MDCSHRTPLTPTRGVGSKGRSLTFLWPRKCCSSLISRKARLAKIFLLKMLVSFLIATSWLVALCVAALCENSGS